MKENKKIMESLNITDEKELDNESIFRTKLGNYNKVNTYFLTNRS